MTEIVGKIAVVTGGGSGIGMGLAKELARQGASVAVADIDIESARAVAERINANGGTAIAVHCDLCSRETIRAMSDEVKARLGTVQLVFANAGATSFTTLADMTDDHVDWIVQVNLMGTINTVRAFLPGMIEAGGGHLCATASMAGLLPGWIPDHVPYSAAKAGIIGMMMNLSLELNRHQIYTTSYCPGGVASGMKLNNESYRPEAFGGPGPRGSLHFSGTSTTHSDLDFFHPEDVAPIVLDAVRHNRAFAFDHAEQHPLFHETYVKVVDQCYEAAARWEAANGRPPANPTGAELAEATGR